METIEKTLEHVAAVARHEINGRVFWTARTIWSSVEYGASTLAVVGHTRENAMLQYEKAFGKLTLGADDDFAQPTDRSVSFEGDGVRT